MTPARAITLALDTIRAEIDRRMIIYEIMVERGLEAEVGDADEFPLSVRELRTAVTVLQSIVHSTMEDMR